jgi:oleate hydratase
MNIYRTLYHARKPEGIEKKKAYIIGGGIAGLATAAFLVDDAGMPGENITILEKSSVVGGSMDGAETKNGYLCRGERELEPYMECLWYLCSKIPSLEESGRTVLDETVDVNKDFAIHSESRMLQNRGHIYEKIHDYRMSPKLQAKIEDFLAEPEKYLEDVSIEDYFGKNSDFFESSLWLCFHSMLAFKPYHSALEAQRYLQRFGLANRIDYLEGILHTKRNEYDSIIKPLKVWQDGFGVKTVYGCSAYDLDLDTNCNTVHAIRARLNGKETLIEVREQDLVFVTNGSMTTNSRFGNNTRVAETIYSTDDMGLFELWTNLAKKHEKFGHPEKFLGQVDKTKWMSFFLTVKDYPDFFQRMERMTGSKSGTGGAITIKDSGWGISFAIYDREYFPNQGNKDVLWGDGLFGERPGDTIKKPMSECTGEEILTEFLYHLNMLDMREELLKHTFVSTVMMPYITSQFMPRKETDRPCIVPEGCTNLAFIGQYVEVAGDVVFTVETSVRTPLEAVYALTHLDKDIIEVYPSKYDMRYFLERFKKNGGIEGKVTEKDLPRISPFKLLKLKKTLLEQINNIPPYYKMYPGRDQTVPDKKSILDPKFPKDY